MHLAVQLMRAWALGIALLATSAHAQGYPDRPIRLLIGFAPGSSADVSARIVADQMGTSLGRPVVVEVRAGASSNIAADAAAKAEPDGYTLFLGSVANVISRGMKQAGSLDMGKDLKAVGLICAVPNILVVNPSVQATTVKELIATAKANPGMLNYGSPGPGTIPHLSGELFNVMAGVSMVHVSYKGTAQAAQDVVGGTLQVMFAPSSTVLGLIEGKLVRALGWTITTRGPSLPDLPTVAEAGLPGFDTSIWFGLNAPPATPDAIVAKLGSAVVAAVKSETVAKAFRAQGIEPLSGGPAEYAKYIAGETTKWNEIVVKAGLAK
jgi:tripartite-type tricarboxylate transporter receptor subunit TctC